MNEKEVRSHLLRKIASHSANNAFVTGFPRLSDALGRFLTIVAMQR